MLAGAVNTLKLTDDGILLGDNTDGAGLVADLLAHFGDLSGLKILLLGAGGAARGVIGPLLEQHLDQLVIVNRTVAKAQALAERFADLGPVSASSYEALSGDFDIIINSTSGEIIGSEVLDDSIVVTAIQFEKAEYHIANINIKNCKDSFDAGRQLADVLTRDCLKHVMVISDGAPVDDSTISTNERLYLDNHLKEVKHCYLIGKDSDKFVQMLKANKIPYSISNTIENALSEIKNTVKTPNLENVSVIACSPSLIL